MKKKVVKILKKALSDKDKSQYDEKILITNSQRIKREELPEGAFSLRRKNEYKRELNSLKKKYLSLNKDERVKFLKKLSG